MSLTNLSMFILVTFCSQYRYMVFTEKFILKLIIKKKKKMKTTEEMNVSGITASYFDKLPLLTTETLIQSTFMKFFICFI